MKLIVLPDEQAVANEAAERTVSGLRDAIDTYGVAHLNLTGGSGVIPLYEALARPPWNDALDWHQVHFWWGDDRFVPRDHPESNVGAVYRLLFNVDAFSGESGEGSAGADVEAGDLPGLLIDADKVHPIDNEGAIAAASGPDWAAAAYQAELKQFARNGAAGLPAFDVFLVGMGPDGHCLSVFPNSPALQPDAPLVMGIEAPTHVEPHLPRVTMVPRVMEAAGAVLMIITGDGKAELVANVLEGERDPSRLPAQTAILDNAVWLLDEAAAAQLRNRG